MTASARRHLLAGLALATATLPHAGEAQSLPPDGETATSRLAASPRHGEWVTYDAGSGDEVESWVSYPERTDDGILRRNQALQELLDLARTVVADGELTKIETEAFQHWVNTNPDMSGVWPVGIVTRALKRAFADGQLSEADRAELLELLEDVAGRGQGANPKEWGKLQRTDDHFQETDE